MMGNKVGRAEFAGEVFPGGPFFGCKFGAGAVGVHAVDKSALSGVSFATATLAAISALAIGLHDNDAILQFMSCSQEYLLDKGLLSGMSKVYFLHLVKQGYYQRNIFCAEGTSVDASFSGKATRRGGGPAERH